VSESALFVGMPSMSAVVDRTVWNSYQALPRGSLKHEDMANVTGAQVEMVTVPALGPEWKASELREVTRSAKKERNAEARGKKWKEWRRGERGLCCHWFTWRFTVFFVFGLCIAWVDHPSSRNTCG